MIRINEGKAVEKYLIHMLNKYSSDDEDLLNNYLYFINLFVIVFRMIYSKDG